jgi:hypothetical protein
MNILGPVLCLGVYALLGVHVYCYLTMVAKVLPKRIGLPCYLIWSSIGLTLVYNTIHNHFLASWLKPGSPQDVRKTEEYRTEGKQRAGRK